MDKYRPEDKQAKKERLKARAEAKASGKVGSSKQTRARKLLRAHGKKCLNVGIS